MLKETWSNTVTLKFARQPTNRKLFYQDKKYNYSSFAQKYLGIHKKPRFTLIFESFYQEQKKK